MANDPTLVFLDANVLARPVTRTLLLIGADESGLAVTWSAYVEAEADRHLRGSALPVSDLRKRLDRVLGPTGAGPDASKRRPTVRCSPMPMPRARVPGNEDVDDFAEVDLAALRLSAVHPDLFMALRFPRHAYLRALDLLVGNMKNPPRAAAEMHGLIARQHPRLFSAHSDAHEGVRPADPVQAEPSVTVRGTLCAVRVGCRQPWRPADRPLRRLQPRRRPSLICSRTSVPTSSSCPPTRRPGTFISCPTLAPCPAGVELQDLLVRTPVEQGRHVLPVQLCNATLHNSC